MRCFGIGTVRSRMAAPLGIMKGELVAGASQTLAKPPSVSLMRTSEFLRVDVVIAASAKRLRALPPALGFSAGQLALAEACWCPFANGCLCLRTRSRQLAPRCWHPPPKSHIHTGDRFCNLSLKQHVLHRHPHMEITRSCKRTRLQLICTELGQIVVATRIPLRPKGGAEAQRRGG